MLVEHQNTADHAYMVLLLHLGVTSDSHELTVVEEDIQSRGGGYFNNPDTFVWEKIAFLWKGSKIRES